MSILDRLLKKRGLSSPEELDNTPTPDGSPTERETFDRYKAVLSKEALTIDDIKQFCEQQIDNIEAKWSDLNLPQEKKAELIPYHTVYSILLRTINSPQTARAQLEKQLEQMLNQ